MEVHHRAPRGYRPLSVSLLVLVAIVVGDLVGGCWAVVVDGEKKSDVSATNHQSDEKSSIDAFNTKTCGISDPNLREHEFVNMARAGQFPWMVSFQIKILENSTKSEQKSASKENKTESIHGRNKNLEDLHFCSGSFISDKWILSAAHCFAPQTIENYMKNDKLKVVAGSHKVSSRSPMNRNLTISRIFYHSKFNKSMPVGFDIALVELEKPVSFTTKRKDDSNSGEQSEPFMNTICLPLKDKRYKFNETARIAGWGLSNEEDISSMPSKLLTTDILLSKPEECAKIYEKSLKSSAPTQQRQKFDDFICASYKNTRDACQSDSGGPLMQYADRKAVAVGVVSYGIGCATKGVPGLYTRTSAYVNWIKDITMNGKQSNVPFNLIEAAKLKSQPRKSQVDTTRRPVGANPHHGSKPLSTSRPSTTSTTTTGAPSQAGGEDSDGGFKYFDE